MLIYTRKQLHQMVFGCKANSLQKTMKYYVLLQFWFCRHIGLSLPLIALQYYDVKLKFEFINKSIIFRI